MNASTVYLLIRGISWFFFYTAFVYHAVYLIEMVGLDPLRLVLVGTVVELSIFLFEIPTGVVADSKSRRLSVILGYLLIGVGFALEGALPIYATILLSQVIWGVGFTFTSGAEDAWIADEVGEERLPEVLLRGEQAKQIGSFAGILLSTTLAFERLNLPLLVSGGGFVVLALALMAIMPERGFAPTPKNQRGTWQGMARTFREGVGAARRRHWLLTLMGAALFLGLGSEGIDRLWEKHLLESFTMPSFGRLSPLGWFGLINAVAMVVTLLTTEGVRRRALRLEHRSLAALFFVQQVLVIVALAIFAITGNFFVAVLAYVAIYTLGNTVQPLFMEWINRGLESNVRATVLSTVSQFDAAGQVMGGPVVGSVASSFGLRRGLLTSAGFLVPVLAFYLWVRRQGGPRERADSSNR